ncbi:hypothetical protein BC629DRAFT_1515996 [Irpex lacteus]|nr:hypothetical protein BC629DRAFT_1515996 [Irpex lacteus]
MSRRPIFPLIVAGATGILSGVYIFKPLLDNRSSSADQPTSVRSNVIAPSSNQSQPSSGSEAATSERTQSQAIGVESKSD